MPSYLNPKEVVEYLRLDEQFKQVAEQLRQLQHQSYTAFGAPQEQLDQLQYRIEQTETRKNGVADALYRLCERARKRKANPSSMLPKPRKTPAKGQQWLSKIVRSFGYTENPAEAGYIHPNGRMIDFSGRKRGHAQNGMRAQDHREVASFIPELSQLAENPKLRSGRTHAMRTFMMHSGAIRLIYGQNRLQVDLAAVPTRQQMQAIMQLAKHQSEVTIDARRAGEDDEPYGKTLNAETLPVTPETVRRTLNEAIRHLQQNPL